jgi:hypothetical protein
MMTNGQETGVICSKTNHNIKIGDTVMVKIFFSPKFKYKVTYGKIRILSDDWGVDWYAYCPHIKWEDGSGGLAIVEDNVYWAGE